jgi:hypothetical protein
MNNDLPAQTGHHWARTVAGLALVATSILFVVSNGPAHAAAATHLTLDNVDKAVTKGEDNSFFLAARDANGAKDSSYTGEVSFTPYDVNGSCSQCAEIRTSADAAPITSYTFDGSEGGRRELFVRWLKTGSGFRLDATGPVEGGSDTASARGITVSPASGTTTTTSSTTTTILPTTTTTTTPTSTTTSTSTTTPASTTTTQPVTTTTTTALTGCDNPATSAATVTPSAAPAGASVTMRGKCMAPNATVTVRLDTTTIGTTTADAFGQFATILSIPARTSAGAHTLSASGAGGKGGTHTASATITVTASSGGTLSRTGSESGRQTVAAICLLAAGFALVAIARKPRGEHF